MSLTDIVTTCIVKRIAFPKFPSILSLFQTVNFNQFVHLHSLLNYITMIDESEVINVFLLTFLVFLISSFLKPQNTSFVCNVYRGLRQICAFVV
jgi:hypothetical protein